MPLAEVLGGVTRTVLGEVLSDSGAPFTISLTGLTNGEAIIGDHATISYTTDPVSATETVKWSNSANPADAATYGTGANPTDYTAGDEGRLYLHVTDTVEGETATVTRSALIRYARGTAPAVADGQAWTVDDTTVNIDGSASGANLTFTYAVTGLPAGVSINASTGAITGTPTAVDSGTATITATDQYGLDYTDTFTWANTLRTQATAAGGLGPFSFTQDAAISSQDLSADFTANGNTLTYTISPALPAGLSLASNGILSGTPTATAASATYTVTGQDEYGRDTDSSFTLEVVEDAGFTLPASVVSAHSVARAIDSSYSGDLIRVRRSSDNAEADIGTDGSGNLDEAALLAHVGTGGTDDGFIVTVYEQSGDASAVDMAQSTASLQPQIVDAGAVVKKDSQVAYTTVGLDRQANVGMSGWNTRPSNATILIVCAANTNETILVGNNNDNRPFSFALENGSPTAPDADVGTPSYFANNASLARTRGDLWSGIGIDELLIARATSLDASDANMSGLALYYGGGDFTGPDYFSEIVIMDAPSSGDIDDMEGNQATAYGVTLA